MFKSIVVVTVLGLPSAQLTDERGPYHTMLECASRGHEIMKTFFANPPSVILSMQAVCVEMPEIENPGGSAPKTESHKSPENPAKKRVPKLYDGPTKRL